jgi:hypothetical protein
MPIIELFMGTPIPEVGYGGKLPANIGGLWPMKGGGRGIVMGPGGGYGGLSISNSS